MLTQNFVNTETVFVRFHVCFPLPSPTIPIHTVNTDSVLSSSYDPSYVSYLLLSSSKISISLQLASLFPAPPFYLTFSLEFAPPPYVTTHLLSAAVTSHSFSPLLHVCLSVCLTFSLQATPLPPPPSQQHLLFPPHLPLTTSAPPPYSLLIPHLHF